MYIFKLGRVVDGKLIFNAHKRERPKTSFREAVWLNRNFDLMVEKLF
jgi:hypothetical protein